MITIPSFVCIIYIIFILKTRKKTIAIQNILEIFDFIHVA